MVAVRQGSLLGTSFHPEITGETRFHEYFLVPASRVQLEDLRQQARNCDSFLDAPGSCCCARFFLLSCSTGGMKLYSDFGGRRTAQIVGDLAAIAVIVIGIVVAVAIHDAIAGFKGIGADVQRSGSDFSSTMSDIGSKLSGVPLIGGGISAPFTTASDAGGTLADAGSSWQTGVEHLATLVGWTVACLVVLVVLVGWVRPRHRRRGPPRGGRPPRLRLLVARPAGAPGARDPAGAAPSRSSIRRSSPPGVAGIRR